MLIVLGFKKERSFGKLFKKGSKTPLPFFTVALFDKFNKRVTFAVTDALGRFYLLVPKSEKFLVKAKGITLDGEHLQTEFETNGKKGLLNREIGL